MGDTSAHLHRLWEVHDLYPTEYIPSCYNKLFNRTTCLRNRILYLRLTAAIVSTRTQTNSTPRTSKIYTPNVPKLEK